MVRSVSEHLRGVVLTDYESIPKALASTPNWLGYRLVDTGKGRLSKPPVSPRTGQVCAKNDESNFTTLTDALVGATRFDLDGVGFVFTEGFVCIDLDDCFDEDGNLSPVAQDVFDHFSETYWEYSPSGNGLHGIMRGVKPHNRTKDSALGIEVYGGGYHFVTVTGDHVAGTGTDAVNAQDALDWLYETYLPQMVVTQPQDAVVEHGEMSPDEWLALALSKDTKLREAYNSTDHDGDESSSDFSLLTKLAYWLNRDESAVTSAFLASPWVSSKDKAHTDKLKRRDYLPDSVTKAIALTRSTAYQTSRVHEMRASRFFTLADDEEGEAGVNLEDLTDLGNATALAKVFGDTLTYTPEWGWCFFDGVRWETDVPYRAMEAAREIALALKAAAVAWMERVEGESEDIDPDELKARLKPAKDLYAHALKSQSERGLTAMVGLNKSFMCSSASNFDTDPWLLNTPTGVVDLKTGEQMPHDSKYRLTSMTALAVEDTPTPMWDAFLTRIFRGDADLIAFVQKVIGSALIGKVYSENLIIANGTGANGKSTLFNTIQYLLGDYATSIDPDLLMSSRPNERQVGMAMLDGKRFAVAQETEEGQRIKSSMLKKICSTDTMVAKRLYKDPHEFTPTHTMVLSTNHLPKVSSTDRGTWRRIVVIPFEETIPPEDIITDFHSLLIEREGAGILHWAVQGAVAYWEGGCDISERPEAVTRASTEYRSEEDWIARFAQECCVEANAETYTSHTDLYRVYNHWAKDNGEYVRSSNAFARALQSAGWRGDAHHYDTERQMSQKVWFGISLIDGGRSFKLVQGGARRRGVETR